MRFVPPDDEGFTLRGDRRRLFYKGRRRSHRFTILGDTAFEYDCILEKEPENNVISLLMEGAEDFGFFRQPDFVEEPFLKGSYAVYKKETLLGEGTGKLCHIHRPQIIDAQGRRCWGDLAVVGDKLCITIPEGWLGEAKYPVIVDPTVGTTTVGSNTHWYWPDHEEYEQLYLEIQLAVNKFLIPEKIDGLCTAYIYTALHDGEAGGRGIIYSDNGNKPYAKLSANENFIDLRFVNGNSAGWRSGTFSGGGINAGSSIWFGVCTEFMWYPRFDFGSLCYSEWWDDYIPDIPDRYPAIWDTYDFKLSMYFDYSSAQNYVRTLTQGVRLSDSRKQTGNYKRVIAVPAGIKSLLGRFELFYRKSNETVFNSMSISCFPSFCRSVKEQVKATTGNFGNKQFVRKCFESVKAELGIRRIQGFFCNVREIVAGLDNMESHVLIFRTVTETAAAFHNVRHWGSYLRGLRLNAGSVDDASTMGTYYRKQKETVQPAGTVFRGLLLSVRIVTGLFVRDFLLRRFLVARAQLVLKSCISREITLESRMN